MISLPNIGPYLLSIIQLCLKNQTDLATARFKLFHYTVTSSLLISTIRHTSDREDNRHNDVFVSWRYTVQ